MMQTSKMDLKRELKNITIKPLLSSSPCAHL